MKKLTAYLLILLILMVSCSSNENKPDDTNISPETPKTDVTEAPVETETKNLTEHEVPDSVTLDGRTIRVISLFAGDNPYDLEENGEIVNDAKVRAITELEETLNCDMVLAFHQPVDWSNMTAVIDPLRTTVAAGLNEYDIAAAHKACGSTAACEGLLMNMNSVDYLDFEKSYWSQPMMASLSFKGNHYWATGDITSIFISGLSVTYINADLYGNFFTENVYNIVNEGKYTLDKVKEWSEVVYRDLDGDGEKDMEDQWGLTLQPQDPVDSLMYACDVTLSKMDSDGVPTLDFPKEKFFNVHEKIYNLLNHTEGACFTTEVENDIAQRFLNGTQMIFFSKLSRASQFADMTSDYFILPLPKYDEAQKQYISTIHDSVTLFGIPLLATGTDELGAVLEVYASNMLKYHTPAYFDVALKHRYSRDEESGKILDMVKSTVVNDFVFAYPGGMIHPDTNETLCNIMRLYIRTEDVSSKLASELPVWEAKFNNVIASFEKNAR